MLAELYLALTTAYKAPETPKQPEPFTVGKAKGERLKTPRPLKKAQKPPEPSKRTLNVEATFYTAFCVEGCGGVTATGLDVNNTIYYGGMRIIAVDPRYVPLGSTGTLKLSTGQSYRVTAQDTGGAIKGARIDLLVASESEANRLGRQPAVLKLDEMGTK